VVPNTLAFPQSCKLHEKRFIKLVHVEKGLQVPFRNLVIITRGANSIKLFGLDILTRFSKQDRLIIVHNFLIAVKWSVLQKTYPSESPFR
jgi:hypothetical protein